MLQLDPPIPVVTPKGKALAYGWIDNGVEHDLQWICAQDSTGEWWTWRNQQVRAQINITHGRDHISPFYDPADVAFKGYSSYAPDVPITPEESKPARQQCWGAGKIFVEKSYGDKEDNNPLKQRYIKTIPGEGVEAYQWEGKIVLNNDPRWTPWAHSMPGEGKFLFKDYNGKIFEGEHRASKLRGGSYILLPPEFDGWKIEYWYQEEGEWKRP